jgi:hypothetical protein
LGERKPRLADPQRTYRLGSGWDTIPISRDYPSEIMSFADFVEAVVAEPSAASNGWRQTM